MLQMSTLFLHVNCGLSVEILGFHAKMFSNRRQVFLSNEKQAKSRVKHTNCSNNYSAHCFGESNFITLSTPLKRKTGYIYMRLSLFTKQIISHQSWRLLLLGLSDSEDKLNESTFLRSEDTRLNSSHPSRSRMPSSA